MKSILCRAIFAVSLSIAPIFCGGCAGPGVMGAQEAGQYTMAVMRRTGLFKQGPGQQTPPEEYLDTGTRVRVIRSAGDYMEVQTVSGLTGYVASSDLGTIETETPSL